MKKRIIIPIIISILVITMVVVLAIIHLNKTKKEEKNTNNPEISIKSTLFNPIQKGSIKIEKIDIDIDGKDVDLSLDIRNNKDKDINGFSIDVELLDKDKNVVEPVKIYSLKTIPSKGKITYVWRGRIEENVDKIKSARIVDTNVDDEEETHTVVVLDD